MILLCPLIHPPNRCRSQWLHTNAFFPSILWIIVRLVSSGNERHSKSEMCVRTLLCCVSESAMCVCAGRRMCELSVCLFCCVERRAVRGYLFVFVAGSHLLQSPPLAVMACLWDTDIKLSDWSLSAFDVSWAVHPDLSTRGWSAQYGCCLKISHLLCFLVRDRTKLPSSY